MKFYDCRIDENIDLPFHIYAWIKVKEVRIKLKLYLWFGVATPIVYACQRCINNFSARRFRDTPNWFAGRGPSGREFDV